MRRVSLITTVVVSLLVAASAHAAGPKRGNYTCSDANYNVMASMQIVDKKTYRLNDGKKAKYKYSAAKHTLKFKSGDFKGVYYGFYDTHSKTIDLRDPADDFYYGTCSRDTSKRA